MADSRIAALSILFRRKWPLTQKVSLLLFVCLVSLVLTQWIKTSEMPTPAVNALFLLLLAAGLWISEAIPPFAVSILIIGYSIYILDSVNLAIISQDWEKYIGSWSSPVIWILLGGFFLALGAQVTGFDVRFAQYILNYFGNRPKVILLGCMISTGLLSMFMSNTATMAMMVGISTPIVSNLKRNDPFIKSLYLGLAAAATLGGMGTIIGSPPNAIALGIIQGEEIHFDFSSWMLVGLPIALLMIVLVWLLLIRMFKPHQQFLATAIQTAPGMFSLRNTALNRWIVVVTFCLTIGLWITSSWHHLPVAVISFLPILLFTVSGVIIGEDLKQLPWDMLILVAGGLTLGTVISDTGLSSMLLAQIPIINQLFIMLLLLGWLTALLSNIMSNSAATSVLVPLGLSLLPEKALLVALVIGLSASTALFLPISTPPNAIAYSTGFLRQSDFRWLGLIIGIVGPLLIVCAVIVLFG